MKNSAHLLLDCIKLPNGMQLNPILNLAVWCERNMPHDVKIWLPSPVTLKSYLNNLTGLHGSCMKLIQQQRAGGSEIIVQRQPRSGWAIIAPACTPPAVVSTRLSLVKLILIDNCVTESALPGHWGLICCFVDKQSWIGDKRMNSSSGCPPPPPF